MKLTEQFYKELDMAKTKNYQEGWRNLSQSSTCCGVLELTNLPLKPYKIAHSVDSVFSDIHLKKRNLVLYHAPLNGGYQEILDILKSFGFQSLGTFHNPNTNHTIETLYFMRTE